MGEFDLHRRQITKISSPVLTPDLGRELRSILETHYQQSCPIVALDREFLEYSSSFVIEKLTTTLGDGSVTRLLFKNLSPGAMLPDALRARPEFLYDPIREIQVYRHVLNSLSLGTARFYGAVSDPQRHLYWIFLEWIDGEELYQTGSVDRWGAVAHWLAGLHLRSSELLEKAIGNVSLVHYDREYYECWIERARLFSRSNSPGRDRQAIEWIAECYERCIEYLLDLPVALIHGELFPSNVILQATERGLRICTVDWETAGIGPGLIDLAALTSGNWSANRKMQEQIVEMYRSALHEFSVAPEASYFRRGLDICRLYLAVQRLGWSDRWQPPPQHSRDWLGEALRLAERIDI